jgi:hypothetical protein
MAQITKQTLIGSIMAMDTAAIIGIPERTSIQVQSIIAVLNQMPAYRLPCLLHICQLLKVLQQPAFRVQMFN